MHAGVPAAERLDREVERRLEELAALIERFAPGDGMHATVVDGVSLIRAAQPSEPIPTVYKPMLCVIAQGRKQVMLADEVYVYGPGRHLVVTVDLPLVGEVLVASRERPYLCLALDVQPSDVSALLTEPGLPRPSAAPGSEPEARGLFVSRTDLPLMDAALRLIRLLEAPQDIPILAPLAVREILYRLLQSEQGGQLLRIALAGSQAQRIAKAISLVKSNYTQPLRIEAIAREVHMSPSALHHQFKAVTAMSPLQYQKQLRLQEARRLMLGEVVDAATAGYRVGYESPSQFSREYSRLFGAPPSRDVARLRSRMGSKSLMG
ncbi:AraC family transcriptional regulator [Sorangium sp. So ce887]|uniref:AraC family transcriptional regulator n=1 Tax=Sorangium sp. So ce887 TaxID=3133324 RepID=UPI003F64230F